MTEECVFAFKAFQKGASNGEYFIDRAQMVEDELHLATILKTCLSP